MRATAVFILGMLPPPLLAALTLPGAPDILAGAAAGAYLLSRAEVQKARAIIAAATALIVSVWLPWLAVCWLAGMYTTESLFADSGRLRTARMCAAALCLQIILFALDNNFVSPTVAAAVLAFIFAAVSVGVGGRLRATLDPLVGALLSLLFIAFALSVRLIAVNIGDYQQAVLLAVLGYCVALAALSLLAAPLLRDRSGAYSLSRVFSMEVPLDKWIGDISAIAEDKKNADDFLEAAVNRLAADLPGVEGMRWQTGDDSPKNIGGGKHPLPITCPPLTLTFYRRRFASPWTWLSYYLLCRIVGEYYLSKRREEEQRAQNLLQATHQAGARMTHDIKNILHALAALAATKDDSLVRRQLPILQARLATALAKLRGEADERGAQIPAAIWWNEAQSRHLHTAASFMGDDIVGNIPSALFDRALDNFLENAMHKHGASAKHICATLTAEESGAALRVIDTGSPVAAAVAKDLFIRPVTSANGFGVALYQLAREAELAGYRPLLEHNEDKKVVFALIPLAKDGDKP